MGLFLSIYKKQLLIALTLIIGIVIFSVFSMAEATMFLLITLGVGLAIFGLSSIASHLATKSAFRSCDIKFLGGIISLALAGLCIFEFIQIIMK